MRGEGWVWVVALKRLVSNDGPIQVRLGLGDVASNVITASDETRVFPLTLDGVFVARVDLGLLRSRIVVYSVCMVRVWLVLSALRTVQDASADSGGT